jgi:hypothetical protein
MFTGLFSTSPFPVLAKICPKKPMEYQMAVSNALLDETTYRVQETGRRAARFDTDLIQI